MRTAARHLRIPAVVVTGVFVLGLAACGDDSGAEPTTVPATTAIATTAAPATTAVPASTAAPATTAAPVSTTAAAATTVPGAFTVTVGVDSGEDRIETVKVGQPVTLSITDPNADQEYHVHVVDLGDGEIVPKGTTKVFKFTPTAPGDIEVESHGTEAVLIIIRVVA